jgi:hypothetical protein
MAVFFSLYYLLVPGLSLYPAVKMAAKNATITKITMKVCMLCTAPFVPFLNLDGLA